MQADVSASADVDRFVLQAAQALGGVDILVNCAGVFPQALIEDITDEDWSRVMRINLDGAFYACRAAAPYLKKSGKNGRIINLSSQAALNGTAHGAHYGASKAALLGLTYCLAKKLGPDGITVNAILPGRIGAGDPPIIGEQELRVMKPTAVLINTARAVLVDMDALYEDLVRRI